MSAVVGALRAILSLESAAFTNGLKQAQGGLARFGQQTRAMGAQMQKVGAVMSVVSLGMAAGIRKGINAADDMGDMAEKFGVPVEAFSALAFAAETSGVSLESLGTGLRKLSDKMSDAARGNKLAGELFARLGVSVTDASGAMRSGEQVMADVSEVFANMPDGVEKTALAMDIFGKSGTDMIPLLNKGRTSMKRMADEARNLGLVVSKETADAAGDFNDNLVRLGGAMDGIFVQIAAELAPVLKDISEALITMAKGFTELSPDMRRFAAIAVSVVAVGGPLLIGLGLAVSAVGALASAFAALGALMLANPIILVAAAIAAAALAIWYNWDWLVENLGGIFMAHADLVLPIWRAIANAATYAAQEIRDRMGPVPAWIGEKFTALLSLMAPLWDAFALANAVLWQTVQDGAVMAYGFISQQWANLGAVLAPVWETVKADAQGAWTWIGEQAALAVPMVTGAWTGMREFFGLVLMNIKGAFADGWERIKAYAATWPADFIEFGYQIVEGLKQGILDRWDAMMSSLQGKWQELKDEFADALGIKSPSRVFREFGRNITEGLSLGVQDGAPEAIGAITDVGVTMAETTRTAADQLRDAGKGLFREWVTGAKSASEALAGLASRLADMLADSAFDMLFGGLGGGGGGGGGIFDWLGGLFGFAKGGAFTGGGHMTAFAKGGIVNSPTMFGMPDGLGMMGEAGPEAIMPLTRGAGGRLGVQAIGGTQMVRIVVEEGPMFASRVQAMAQDGAVEVVRQYDAEIAPLSRRRAAREVG